MNILVQTKQTIVQVVNALFALDGELAKAFDATINTDKDRSFGDISSNAAMVVAKAVKKNPRIVAEEIKAALLNTDLASKIEQISIAGPGFLNITFTQAAWAAELVRMHEVGPNFFRTVTKKLRYLLEFVSANPTGPVHLGGGRGGIIGDVIANVLAFLGHDVCREYYINDAGNQIKLLGECFKARCLQELGVAAALPDGGYAGEYLVDLAKSCVAEHGKKLLDQTESYFEDYAKNALLVVVKQDLEAYGVMYDSWFSEKTLHLDGSVDNALQDLQKRDLAYVKDGALWFRSELFGDAKDRVLKKSNGEMTYIAADVAYHKNKFDRGYDRLIDILGQDHHGYVTRLKATMEALGYPASHLDVIVYQLVTIKENEVAVRMSKRAGTFTQLRDVVDAVGKDCARFFYLNRKADAHLEFDLAVALKKTEENPVFYLQYAYVRTGSILEKAAQEDCFYEYVIAPNTSMLEEMFVDYTLSEQDLVLTRKILAFSDVLHAVADNYHSHTLAYYALELAQVFHNYYAHNRVIDVQDIPTSRARLFMVMRVRALLALCLELLGLSKPERM